MLLFDFLSSVKNFLFTFWTLLSLIFSSAPISEAAYEARDPENLVMSFSVVSDVHVETTSSENYKAFTTLLRSIKAGKNHDAAIFLGDNVMNGQGLENYLFYSAVKRVDPAEHNLIALGNHDIGNGEGDYEKMLESFLDYNTKKLDNPIEKPYYYRVIGGCYFIFLATEEQTVNTCVISREQLDWVKNTLEEAEAKNAPTFVFNHHPLRAVEGEHGDELIEALGKYEDLIYFCGHTHMELTDYSFRNYYGINCVYLPRVMGSDEYDAGVGVVVEVYEGEILVRARNFITGSWLDELSYAYPLN